MKALRNLICRWLGIPTHADIRAVILQEIDADAVWKDPTPGETFASQCEARANRRSVAIAFSKRENTRG